MSSSSLTWLSHSCDSFWAGDVSHICDSSLATVTIPKCQVIFGRISAAFGRIRLYLAVFGRIPLYFVVFGNISSYFNVAPSIACTFDRLRLWESSALGYGELLFLDTPWTQPCADWFLMKTMGNLCSWTPHGPSPLLIGPSSWLWGTSVLGHPMDPALC